MMPVAMLSTSDGESVFGRESLTQSTMPGRPEFGYRSALGSISIMAGSMLPTTAAGALMLVPKRSKPTRMSENSIRTECDPTKRVLDADCPAKAVRREFLDCIQDTSNY